jgi:hypothetical protein
MLMPLQYDVVYDPAFGNRLRKITGGEITRNAAEFRAFEERRRI